MARFAYWATVVISLLCIFAALTVVQHTQFEAKKTAHATENRYAIECQDVQLLDDAIEINLSVFDQQKPHDFLKFRLEEIDKYSNYVIVPLRYGNKNSDWERRYRRRKTTIPKTIWSPDSNSDQRSWVSLKFEPLDPSDKDISGKPAPARSEVNVLWLRFEDFPALKLVRTDPVEGGIAAFLVEHLSQGQALLIFFIGLAGMSVVIMVALARRTDTSNDSGYGQTQHSGHSPNVKQEATEMDAVNAVPAAWDSHTIELEFRRFQAKPRILTIFVNELTKRFIIGQDERTARKRIEFLKTKLEELTLTKDLQSCLDDLSLRDLNLHITQLELEIKEASLEEKRRRQNELLGLEHKRDMMKMKVEIARSEKEIRELQTTAPKTPKQKNRTKKDVEVDISRANADEQRVDSNANMSEEEKIKRRNMIARRKDGLFEELEKFK